MKTLSFIVHVVILTLTIIGIFIVGSFVGEVVLKSQGGKFLDIKQQILVAGMLAVLGMVLPHFSRFETRELFCTAGMVQVLIFGIVYFYTGLLDWFYWDWVWAVTQFTTLPFAIVTILSVVIGKKLRKS